MKLDYKRLKKIHSDAHSTTLEHGDGHTIRIAHNKLSPENKEELSKLPMLAEGGDVSQAPQLGSYEDASDTPFNSMLNQQPFQSGAAENMSSQMPPESPVTPSGGLGAKFGLPGATMAQPESPEAPVDASSPKIPTAQTSPAPTGKESSLYQQGINEMKQGLRGAEAATSLQADMEMKAAKDNLDKQAEMQQHYQQASDELEQSRKDLMQDIKDGHINPDHYMDSKSDLGKISTAIGLIMGGFGSVNGGPNPAIDFLNKQIDRDIDAQKANLGKKSNLLSATMQQFGNLKDATQMARVYQTDIYKTKLEQAMATAKSPMAKAALQKAIGELDMTTGPILQEQAQKKAILAGMSSGAASPEAAVQYLVPKEHQKEAFAEIGRAQAAQTHEKDINSWFDKASKENTILKTGAGLARTPASVTNMMNLMMPILKDNEGRINETEIKMMEMFVPKPGDTEDKIGQKRQALNQFIESKKAAPTAKGYGIDLQSIYPSTANQKSIQGAPRRSK